MYLPLAESVTIGGGAVGILLLVLIILAIIYLLRRA
jgi:hypothetical protein